MKVNVIIGLKNRIIKITHDSLRNVALMKLDILTKNGYFRGFLRKLLFSTTGITRIPLVQVPNMVNNTNNDVLPSPIKFGSLPYVDTLTSQLVKIFKVIPNLKLSCYNVKTNSSLFTNLKDKTDKFHLNNIIYKINCLGCTGQYVSRN